MTITFVREQELKALCQGDALSHALFSVDYLNGLVFAVASAPEIPMPEVWLPWIFKEHGQLPDTETADKLTDILMGLLQHQLRLMRDDQVCLDDRFELPPDAQKINSERLALSRWCNGVLAGHTRLEKVWNNAWQKMHNKNPNAMPSATKDLSHCLTMFSTFADLPLAFEQAKVRDNDQQFVAQLPRLFLSLPSALQTYVKLSGTLVEYLPNQFETFSPPSN